MIQMALIIAGFSWLIELMLVCRIPFYYRLMVSSSLLNLLSSLLISFFISSTFSAHGIIVLMSGAFSCVASMLTYRIMGLVRKST